MHKMYVPLKIPITIIEILQLRWMWCPATLQVLGNGKQPTENRQNLHPGKSVAFVLRVTDSSNQ